jgi:hypothetical protein
MIYNIIDNGSTSFFVKIMNNNVGIFESVFNKISYAYSSGKMLMEIKNPKKIFIGKSPINDMTKFSGAAKQSKRFIGNAILIRPNSSLNYIFIGHTIEKFKSDSEIIDFISPVGNNGVPYTYAISKNKLYLLIENITIDIRKIQKWK